MKMSIHIMIFAALACTHLFAAPQASAPGKANPRATNPGSSPQTAAPAITPRTAPSPTPTPPKVNPGVAPAPISNSPQYSPAQLDFGSLWDGESAKRTLSLTAPAAGQVTLSFPGGGMFWLAEYREMGPVTGGSKNSPTSPRNNSFQRQLKTRTTYQVGTPVSPFLQWNVSVGSEIQIDVVFKPVSHPQGSTGVVEPGVKSIIMGLSGPGVIQPWSIHVPARGVFNGSK
jgi:hypothetical protein